ncbi:hypothetical protein D3C87_1753030 [compost metagenome]
MQLGITLDRETGSLLDDMVIQFFVFRVARRRINRRHDLARRGMTNSAHQINRYRTVAQQVPVQRSEERAFE